MTRLVGSLGVLLLLTSASFLRADGVGINVTGSLTFSGFGTTNYFDAANGFVPPGYSNSGGLTAVTIGPGAEFGFEDDANLDTADFDGSTLVITDVSLVGGSNSFEMRFTDPAFLSFALLNDTLGITYSFPGIPSSLISPAKISRDQVRPSFLIPLPIPVQCRNREPSSYLVPDFLARPAFCVASCTANSIFINYKG